MSKKTIYILIGVAILSLIVLLVLSKKGIIGNDKKGTFVEISQVKTTTVVETVSATGKIQPEIEVKISSEVSGEIIMLNVKEGQVVKKGDLLVKINPDLYTSGYNRSLSNLSGSKAGLSQAEATFKEAKANFERSKILFEKGIISKSDWDTSIATFEVAKANKQNA
jgi:HlyD family secretion protein